MDGWPSAQAGQVLAATALERVQRTVQEEWERWFQGCVRFHNRRRQHSALGYATSMQYALQRLPRQARVSHMS